MINKLTMIVVGGLLVAGQAYSDSTYRDYSRSSKNDGQESGSENKSKTPSMSELENLSRTELVEKMKKEAAARKDSAGSSRD